MAEEAARTLRWVENIFSQCNNNPCLEFEIKFCDRFQGLVSEDPADFHVGINVYLFHQLVEHFVNLPETYTQETENETIYFLSSRYVFEGFIIFFSKKKR